MIYTPDKKIQRIHDILVDREVFIDKFPFIDDSEKETFKEFAEKGFEAIDMKNRTLLRRMFKIKRSYDGVKRQGNNLDRYLKHQD